MVAGAGQMGSGIAQSAALSGIKVYLYDIDPGKADGAIASIASRLARDVQKGRRSKEEAELAASRISRLGELGGARDVDLVIEAVHEDAEMKEALFRALDGICREETILASNTSSLSITRLAAVTKRPDKVVGIHFMNPVQVMPLVEVIRGLATSDKTYAAACKLAEQMGKTPIEAGDSPGFVSNRVLMPMINEAIFCVYEGVASPASVDQMMKLGMNHPMGPLALADMIGLDTCLSIMEVLQQGFGDSKYRPCPLLKKYVSAGWLGKKTGRGFYIYE